jgi:hypothetical protein
MPNSTLRALALAAVGAIVSGTLAAQQPSAPPQPIVVRAARMLDVAKGQIVSPAVVTIEGDRIRSVGQAQDTGARVIDLGDVTPAPRPHRRSRPPHVRHLRRLGHPAGPRNRRR